MLNNIIAIVVMSFIIVGSLWGVGNLLDDEEISVSPINSGILLVAQNNLFNNSNPTIYVDKEIPVKLTIVNKDFVKHDFIVDELNINTAYMSAGQDFVTAIASNEPGTFQYYCSLHPSTMDGEIIIR